jgi:hypothetical protein
MEPSHSFEHNRRSCAVPIVQELDEHAEGSLVAAYRRRTAPLNKSAFLDEIVE